MTTSLPISCQTFTCCSLGCVSKLTDITRLATRWEFQQSEKVPGKKKDQRQSNLHIAVKSLFPKHFIYEARYYGFAFPSSFSSSFLWSFAFILSPQNHSICFFQNTVQLHGCPVWLSDAKILFRVINRLPHVQKSLCIQYPLSVLPQETSYCAEIYQLTNSLQNMLKVLLQKSCNV